MLISDVLKSAGYTQNVKIADTLQGSIWRSLQKSTNKSVAIKITEKYLHRSSIGIVGGEYVGVQENIQKEICILKQLSQYKQCPNSIVKYIGSFMSNKHYFLVMEDGAQSLFTFIIRAHRFIATGKIDVAEWHKVCKIIFKQMIESIEYLHNNNVCHLDISLENFLIKDPTVKCAKDGKLSFCEDSIQVKLCDFGVAEIFQNDDFQCNKYCGKTNYKSPEVVSRNTFCAKSNDIWCLGVCLFMIIIGRAPWESATISDQRFNLIMCGDVARLLTAWQVAHLTDRHISDLFAAFFTGEEQRVTINTLKCCKWLQ